MCEKWEDGQGLTNRELGKEEYLWSVNASR